MNAVHTYLPWVLWLAAVGQAMIAMLNLNLVRLMHWEEELVRMPLLVREVFRVHGWFISVTVALFAALTFGFVEDLRTLPLGRALAAGIAAFWGLRTVLQVTFYSAEHWRGLPSRLVAHLALLCTYAGFTLVYAAAAAGL